LWGSLQGDFAVAASFIVALTSSVSARLRYRLGKDDIAISMAMSLCDFAFAFAIFIEGLLLLEMHIY